MRKLLLYFAAAYIAVSVLVLMPSAHGQRANQGIADLGTFGGPHSYGLVTGTAQADEIVTIFVKGTFQNGAALSGNYVVDVTTGSAVSADLFFGSRQFNVAPRITIGGGLGGIYVDASPPSVGAVSLLFATACSTLPACAVAATIPGPICSLSAPCAGDHSEVILTTGFVPLLNGTASLKTGTVVALNPAALNFGVVQVGQSKNLPTTLTNMGSTTLNFSGIATAGTDADEFSQTNTCSSSVGAGKSCTITVTFRPREAGSDNAAVFISDNGGSTQEVSLSGAGCVINPQKHKCVTTLTSPAVRSAIAAPSMVAVPSPTGPSKVGTRVVDLVDSTRDDPFLAEGIKRELLVRFWYPTPAGQDCRRADYTSPAVWARFSQLLAVRLPDVKTNSCLDAPMTDGLHPVVVFTHGYTGTFTDYTFLYEDLASRGYVVASVDHTYEATAVEFPDGRLATSVLGSHLANNWRVDDETLQFAVSVRLDDLRFVLDQLQRINNEASGPFDGKLDMSRVALAGHSLGGLTALLGVRADSRFRAGILLDPYMSEDVSNPTLTPVFLLAAGRTEWSQNELSLWNDLQGPRFAVNFRGAEHVMPSDAVWLAKSAIQAGDMGPDKTIAAIRNYIAAFLDANLRDQPLDPLLRGPSSDYPDAEVTTQRNLLRGRP